MSKNIPARKKGFAGMAMALLTALFFSVIPVSAVEPSPGVPAAPPLPPELTPAELSALTPEQKIARAEALCAAAKFKATRALQTVDLSPAREAFLLADEAAELVSQMAALAADTGDTELAQAALNASIGVGEALSMIVGAAEMIAATGTDPDTVAAADALLASATTSQATNTTTQQTAVATGASMAAAEEAYEAPLPGTAPPGPAAFNPPVVDAEPPITDLPPASPV